MLNATSNTPLLFKVSARIHGNGKGKVLFAWDNQAKYMASTGTSKVVHIHRAINRRGLRFAAQTTRLGYVLFRQITPPGSGICCALEWNAVGLKLAIVQQSSSILVLWNADNGTNEQINISGRDHLCFVKFSNETNHLAVGTTRGTMYILHSDIKKTTTIRHVKSGKIIDGKWSLVGTGNRFAWVTIDKHVHCCDEQGNVLFHQNLNRSSSFDASSSFSQLSLLYPTSISFRPSPRAPARPNNNTTTTTATTTATTTTTATVRPGTTTTVTMNTTTMGTDTNSSTRATEDDRRIVHKNNLLCIEFSSSGNDQDVDSSWSSSTSASSTTDNTASSPSPVSSLLLFNMDSKNSKGIDLEFHSNYGRIIAHRWDSSGMLLVGFEHGYLCGVSCNIRSIWEESFCIKVFHVLSSMKSIVYSEKNHLIACLSKTGVVLVKHECVTEENDDDKTQYQKQGKEHQELQKYKPLGRGDGFFSFSAKTKKVPPHEILDDSFSFSDLMSVVSPLDSICFAQFGKCMSVCDSSGTIYTYVLRASRSTQEGVLPFGIDRLTKGTMGRAIRMLSTPLPMMLLIPLLLFGALSVLCCTAYMMETDSLLFVRAVLGWSAFI